MRTSTRIFNIRTALILTTLLGILLYNRADRNAAANLNTLRATRFELIDSTGRVMAVIGSEDGRVPQLGLRDEAGKARAVMSLKRRRTPTDVKRQGRHTARMAVAHVHRRRQPDVD